MKKIVSFLMAAVMLMGVAGMTVSAAFGDADADSSSTVGDVVVLQQYLAEWDVTIDEELADIDNDNQITVGDVVMLQQYLAEWEVEASVKLPAIGSDIDVVNKRNRIRVSEASAILAQNGKVAVSLTFKNYTTNWITEETDWVQYTCYDKHGNVVQAATKIYIGCIDTKKTPVKTFDFEVPGNTAEIKLTGSRIVFWTEWA